MPRQGREEPAQELILGVEVPRVESDGRDVGVRPKSILHHEKG